MVVKNCANCGSTNQDDALECLVCGRGAFFASHVPVAEVDGAKPVENVTVVVVTEA